MLELDTRKSQLVKSQNETNLENRIMKLESECTTIKTNSTKFFSLVKQLCVDHYGWLRTQKLSQEKQQVSAMFTSPTARHAPKIDFSSTNKKQSRRRESMRNDFFMSTLSNGNESNKSCLTAVKKTKKRSAKLMNL